MKPKYLLLIIIGILTIAVMAFSVYVDRPPMIEPAPPVVQTPLIPPVEEEKPIPENISSGGKALEVKTPIPVIKETLPTDTSSKDEKPKEKPGEVVGTVITYNNILNAVNQERFNVGLDILVSNPALDKVANSKLQDMLKYNYWSHANPETGSTPWTWFEKEFYKYIYAGENLACGSVSVRRGKCLIDAPSEYKTISQLIKAWMDSPTHKANILKEQHRQTGIAISGNLIVQVFSD